MRLRDDEIIGIRVETNAGRYVGRIAGFVVDAESGFIVQYRVRPKGIVAACFPNVRELLIAHDQVVSIDAKRMVIRGDEVGDTGGRRRKRMAPAMSPQPLTSEQR